MAEWSEARASGASPQRRGFELRSPRFPCTQRRFLDSEQTGSQLLCRSPTNAPADASENSRP